MDATNRSLEGYVPQQPRGWTRFALPLLVALTFALYGNTLGNGYVYDDIPLFTENEYVQAGWAGIPSILTTDSYHLQHAQAASENRLVGGRYRPLALITFAIEVATVGQVAWVSHLVNVALYAGVVVALYLLALRLFPAEPGVGLVFAIAFAVHPIHTEVVANVKGRDELLSLLFMILTCLTAYRSLPGGAVAFVLALLSKEYAATLIVLVPLWGWLQGERARIPAVLGLLCLLLAGTVAWRMHWVGRPAGEVTGVLNHPYLYATPIQAVCTKLRVLGIYLRLLVWPVPQSYDYSFAQIPYTGPTDPWVGVSLLLYLGILGMGGKALRARDPVAFPVFWFLGTIALVSNLIANAGTILAERLLFHPSAGALLAATAWMMRWGRGRAAWIPWLRVAGLAALAAASWRTMHRNLDWRDEATLFIGDARAAPHSALVCGNAGGKYLDLYFDAEDAADRGGLLAGARHFTERAFRIDPTAVEAALNLAIIAVEEQAIDEAEHWLEQARTIDPGHPAADRVRRHLARAWMVRAVVEARKERWDLAEAWLRRALVHDPANKEAWVYLGGLYLETGAPDRAQAAWRRTGGPIVWQGF